MSTVAWDGQTLAADQRADMNGQRILICKIHRVRDGKIIAFTGGMSEGQLMVEWFLRGAKPEDYPSCQRTERWSRLIVAGWMGMAKIASYEMEPIAHVYQEPFMAWGSGGGYAMGALAMGATARKAIEIASAHDLFTGGGVDSFEWQKT